MALMAKHGEITPMPDGAIFADTGWEPRAVYEHLKRLVPLLPFPVHIVSAGNIREDIIAGSNGERWVSIPAYYGERTPIRRQCTAEYKIKPIERKTRELLGITRKRSPRTPVIEQWLGISLDEIIRATPARNSWQLNRHPLIELRMTRWDCLRWMEKNGYPEPPRSACIGCPFRSNASWRTMREHSPEEWKDAIEIDRKIRTGIRKIRKELFLHRSARPLASADLSTEADHGQLNLFNEDCAGLCGV
jgi:hypothetical protein